MLSNFTLTDLLLIVLVVIGSIIIATFALRVVSSLFREEASRV